MGVKQVYITLMGRSGWALLNCYYAVLRETSFRPTEILIVTEKIFSAKIGPIREGLTVLSEGFGISPQFEEIVLEEADFKGACIRIPEAILERKSIGSIVALDITSGRKALIAGALIGVPRESLDHVFYLAISTTEGAAKPYLMIPFQLQKLKDFKNVAATCPRVGS